MEYMVEGAAHMGSPSFSTRTFLNTEHTHEDHKWDVPQIYLTLGHSSGAGVRHWSDKCQEKEWGLRALCSSKQVIQRL